MQRNLFAALAAKHHCSWKFDTRGHTLASSWSLTSPNTVAGPKQKKKEAFGFGSFGPSHTTWLPQVLSRELGVGLEANHKPNRKWCEALAWNCSARASVWFLWTRRWCGQGWRLSLLQLPYKQALLGPASLLCPSPGPSLHDPWSVRWLKRCRKKL